MAHYYPPLDPVTIKNLLVVKRLAEESAEYVAEWPYPRDLESLFSKSAPRSESEVVNIDVVAELQETYTQLKGFKPAADDSSAAMSYFRNASSLLEKLLDNIERGKNAKQVSDFYRKVLELLDDVCTPSQRTTVQEQLSAWSQE